MTSITDLPDNVLLLILQHMENIREKIRLLRVSKKFNQIIKLALSAHRYKLLTYNDYLYPSEVISQTQPETSDVLPWLPLNQLLQLAPCLTHYLDNTKRIFVEPDYDDDGTVVPLNLSVAQQLIIRLVPTQYFKETNNYPTKLKLFFGQSPNLVRLQLRVKELDEEPDWSSAYQFPLLFNLKDFQSFFFTDYNAYLAEPYNDFFGIASGQAPNLEQFEVKFGNGYYQEFSMCNLLNKLAENCPKLKRLEISSNIECVINYGGNREDRSGYPKILRRFETRATKYGSPYSSDRDLSDDDEELGYRVRNAHELASVEKEVSNFEFTEFKCLTYLRLEGFEGPRLFWSKLLAKCPNLKKFYFDGERTSMIWMHEIINELKLKLDVFERNSIDSVDICSKMHLDSFEMP